MASNYRVGTVTFQPVTNDYSNTRTLSSKTAMAQSYGSGFLAGASGPSGPSGEETLGNAVKLTMRATVTYRLSLIHI